MYVEQNIGADTGCTGGGVLNSCNALAGEEDPTKSAWFGPDWRKTTQQEVEHKI